MRKKLYTFWLIGQFFCLKKQILLGCSVRVSLCKRLDVCRIWRFCGLHTRFQNFTTTSQVPCLSLRLTPNGSTSKRTRNFRDVPNILAGPFFRDQVQENHFISYSFQQLLNNETVSCSCARPTRDTSDKTTNLFASFPYVKRPCTIPKRRSHIQSQSANDRSLELDPTLIQMHGNVQNDIWQRWTYLLASLQRTSRWLHVERGCFVVRRYWWCVRVENPPPRHVTRVFLLDVKTLGLFQQTNWSFFVGIGLLSGNVVRLKDETSSCHVH